MGQRSQVTYTVRVHDDPPHGFWAEVEELPGCFAAGDTMDELWESLEEAIGLYLSSPESTATVEAAFGEETVVERKFVVCSQ